MLERLVGLPEVNVLGLFADDERVELHIESVTERPGCVVCRAVAQLKGWREVVLVDLQFGGKPAALHSPARGHRQFGQGRHADDFGTFSTYPRRYQ
jgi:hypothetical protein